MSSFPGSSLEDYVNELWLYARDITPEQFAKLVGVYEPYREQIEKILDDFDDDTMSWRTYLGSAFDSVAEDADAKAGLYLKELSNT